MVPAAFHPAVSEIFFGERGVSCGGLFSPKLDTIRTVAQGHRNGLLGATWTNLMEVDRVAFLDFVGFRTGLRFSLARRVQAFNSDGRTAEQSQFNVFQHSGARFSDNFPLDASALSCRTWWYADGLEAEWVVTDAVRSYWDSGRRRVHLAPVGGPLCMVDQHWRPVAGGEMVGVGGALRARLSSPNVAVGWMDEQGRLPRADALPPVPALAGGRLPLRWELSYLSLLTLRMGMLCVRDPITSLARVPNLAGASAFVEALLARYDERDHFKPPLLVELVASGRVGTNAATPSEAAAAEQAAASATASLNE
jgi:hypothetical protein